MEVRTTISDRPRVLHPLQSRPTVQGAEHYQLFDHPTDYPSTDATEPHTADASRQVLLLT